LSNILNPFKRCVCSTSPSSIGSANPHYATVLRHWNPNATTTIIQEDDNNDTLNINQTQPFLEHSTTFYNRTFNNNNNTTIHNKTNLSKKSKLKFNFKAKLRNNLKSSSKIKDECTSSSSQTMVIFTPSKSEPNLTLNLEDKNDNSLGYQTKSILSMNKSTESNSDMMFKTPVQAKWTTNSKKGTSIIHSFTIFLFLKKYSYLLNKQRVLFMTVLHSMTMTLMKTI
jgi:hypothetical protein